MKTNFRSPILATALLAMGLLLSNCDPGTPPSNPPEVPPETPPEIDTRVKSGYSPDQNMVAPFLTDYFDFYNRDRSFPFNQGALAKQGITRLTMTQYTISDNEVLLESDKESGLIPARRVEASFNANGDPLAMHYQSMIVGQVADSAKLDFRYGAGGQVEAIDIKTPDGNSEATYTFQSDRLVRFENPDGTSVSYQEDEENGFSYETHYLKDGGGTVKVSGPVGSFSDEACIELQEVILNRASSFVDYGHAPSLKAVIFTEEDKGNPVRRVEMAGLADVYGTFLFEYREEGVIGLVKFDDAPWGGLKTETRYTYNEFGDLTKVTFNEENPEANNLTVVQKFQYDKQGRLTKRIRSKKVGIGSLSLDRLDFFSYP